MFNRIMHYTGIVACLGLIAACFMPWAYYKQIGDTFTGFHVTRFLSGTYYGRAGFFITIVTGIILILTLLPKIWGKRVNLFLAALLFAYCIRTYLVFTSSLFEGDVQKKPGIVLILVFSFLVLLSTVFPKIDAKNAGQS